MAQIGAGLLVKDTGRKRKTSERGGLKIGFRRWNIRAQIFFAQSSANERNGGRKRCGRVTAREKKLMPE
jgi:hypothetical protein